MFDFELYRRERLARINSEIIRFQDLLGRRSDIKKAILFGSCAAGEMNAFSDIDLIVVMETEKNFSQRQDDIYLYLNPEIQTEVLVYTPEEFTRLSAERIFIRRAAETGKVLVESG
ncbi:nucleotidyltransferase domain-containing protein [bacterium]|nr:nucleotidyltransferase domain-containing protein [FCB group bacterium]MBL7191116.1 nucleotidyltransferase domain-containing protein [bacterium]